MLKDGAVKAGKKYCRICNTWVPFSRNKKHRKAHAIMDKISEQKEREEGAANVRKPEETAAEEYLKYHELLASYKKLEQKHEELMSKYRDLKHVSVYMGKAFVTLLTE